MIFNLLIYLRKLATSSLKEIQSGVISIIIANTKKYLQSDWLTGVQYWPYLYSFFNICTLPKQEKTKRNTTFDFRSGKIEMLIS